MRVPAVLSFEISGDLLCMANLPQEVFFRNVVGVVDEMITGVATLRRLNHANAISRQIKIGKPPLPVGRSTRGYRVSD
jgi:hypothetical protein